MLSAHSQRFLFWLLLAVPALAQDDLTFQAPGASLL